MSKYILNVIISPNVNVFISNNEIKILNITDQILKNFIYFGNIYPSKVTEKQKNIILDVAMKIGKYLQKEGFRGLFGCDFIINKNGDVYIVEINSRRQGSYTILALLNENLIKCELDLFLNKKLNLDNFNFEPNFCWAHSKLKKISSKRSKIKNEINFNLITTPFKEIGSEFYISFYLKNYKIKDCYLGYYLLTGKKYDEVFQVLNKRTKELVKELVY